MDTEQLTDEIGRLQKKVQILEAKLAASRARAKAEEDCVIMRTHERDRERARSARLEEQIDELEKAVRERKAELKRGWIFVPPVGQWEKVAVIDGDSWHWGWENDGEWIDGAGWPFEQEYVTGKDWEAIGFRIEMA